MGRERNWFVLGRIIFPAMLLVWAIGLFIGVAAQTSTVGSISGTVRDPVRIEVQLLNKRQLECSQGLGCGENSAEAVPKSDT